MVEFKEWPKIPRGQNEIITVTEKIDGTNACVIIENGVVVGTQSRNRLITPDDDNYGFARWVEKHKGELALLGDGYHYGEWAGPGIQKNPHNLDKLTFFLFNTHRWQDGRARPACCDVVPILFEGNYKHDTPDLVMGLLKEEASKLNYIPEGIVVWYHKTRRYEKYTFKNSEGKWAAN